MSYSGLVTKLKVRPHPNADKLAIGQCGAYQVVVGKDTPDLTLGVFFAVDGQLSEAFCKQHDLISRKDDQGNRAGGYFAENRKVRCQKLRGEKSEGFWMPLKCLEFTGADLSQFKEGDQVTTVNGVEICRKYFTPATLRAMGNRSTVQRRECLGFPKHFDTEQFKRESHKIPAGVVLYVTEKLHGTSHRIGFTIDRQEIRLSLLKRIVNKVRPMFPTEKKEFVWVNGTRNTILERKENPLEGFHGNEGFRLRMTDPLRGLLHKGEVIYGEIVGFTETGAPIMGSQPIGDKELQKKYGKTMCFSYGNEPWKCSFYVYRITMVNEDGVSVDLSDAAMRKRCEQLGLNPVPMILPPFVYDGDAEALKAKLSSLIETHSTVDSKHCMEGVCVRWDSYPNCKILKLKSFVFLNMEDEQKSDANFVDTEEAA